MAQAREHYGHVLDIRIHAALQHVDDFKTVEGITGIVVSRDAALNQSFLSGWDAALRAYGHGELLAEANALQGQLVELDISEKDRLAMLEFVNTMEIEIVAAHGFECQCNLCKALNRYWERKSEVRGDPA
jgi:hypothetical protein